MKEKRCLFRDFVTKTSAKRTGRSRVLLLPRAASRLPIPRRRTRGRPLLGPAPFSSGTMLLIAILARIFIGAKTHKESLPGYAKHIQIPITPAATGIPHGAQAWMMNEVAAVPPEALLVGIGIEVVLLGVTFWTSFGLASGQIKGAAN